MTPTDGFEVIPGARPPRPFYLVIDRPLAALSPRVQTLVSSISQHGTMVLGWNGGEDGNAPSLASFCALNGIDPQQAAFIGSFEPTKKIAFGATYLVETEGDLIDALMDILA